MWDYHVVLALKPHSRNRSSDLHGPAAATNGPGDASSPESSSLTMDKRNEDRDREDQAQSAWVYDFDSRSPTPCKWKGKSSQDLYVESRTDLLTSCARHALCHLSCRVHSNDISVRLFAARVRADRAEGVSKVRAPFVVSYCFASTKEFIELNLNI